MTESTHPRRVYLVMETVTALAFALALAFGAVQLVRLVQRRSALAPVAGSLATVLVAGWILPALSNGLYISEMDVPNYWRQAAKTADVNPELLRYLNRLSDLLFVIARVLARQDGAEEILWQR